jgi:methylmalonyl-CoA carboxyltransferase large subunit
MAAAISFSALDRIRELRVKKSELKLGGGQLRVEKQHLQGKLTARERIERLIDRGTFHESGLFAAGQSTALGANSASLAADGVVTGSAAVGGRLVHLASQDFTVAGGSAGAVHCDKIVEVMRASLKTGSPFIFINDSGGARVQEGIDSLAGYGRIFYHNTLLSGVVPQISLICGPCAGGAAYSPALTDFIIQTRQSRMFITGPSVIKQVTGEEVTAEQLGGPKTQLNVSGVAHFVAQDDEEAVGICKELLSYLPSNNLEDTPPQPFDAPGGPDEVLNQLIPENPKQCYDVRTVIARLVDYGRFLEVQAGFAANVVVGFARIGGRSVGMIANQPNVLAGALDINASDKVSRLVRFCNAFNLPLVTLVDVPGFLPGTEQEYGGIIRHGAKMLFAYSAATVPKITVVMRKAYGGAYLAMCGKDLGADCLIAWPSAEIAVMGGEGAVEILFNKEVNAAADPRKKRAELIEKYRAEFLNPYVAASHRQADDIVEPAETRAYLIRTLDVLSCKREARPPKKHGLIPL